MPTKKTSQKKQVATPPPLLVNVTGTVNIPNYKKANKALMAVFEAIDFKLDKAIKESEKDEFTEWDTRQTYLMGYRKALRDLLKLKPE